MVDEPSVWLSRDGRVGSALGVPDSRSSFMREGPSREVKRQKVKGKREEDGALLPFSFYLLPSSGSSRAQGSSGVFASTCNREAAAGVSSGMAGRVIASRTDAMSGASAAGL